MSWWIYNESFWAMVALLVLWLEGGTYWTGHTSFSVPEWFVWRALTLIVLEDSTSGTFANLCCWVYWSWRVAFTFAWLRSGAILGSLWAWFALFWYWVQEFTLCGVTFYTIVRNLGISISAFQLLEIAPSPGWIFWIKCWLGNSFEYEKWSSDQLGNKIFHEFC